MYVRGKRETKMENWKNKSQSALLNKNQNSSRLDLYVIISRLLIFLSFFEHLWPKIYTFYSTNKKKTWPRIAYVFFFFCVWLAVVGCGCVKRACVVRLSFKNMAKFKYLIQFSVK